jgi:hypothetical protein
MQLHLFFWHGRDELGPPPVTRPVFDFKNAEAPFIYTWSLPFKSMKKYKGEIDWKSPREHVRIAVKNGKSGNVTHKGNFKWSGEDPNEWYPMDIRYSAVVVKKGHTFSGWENYINPGEK